MACGHMSITNKRPNNDNASCSKHVVTCLHTEERTNLLEAFPKMRKVNRKRIFVINGP